MSTRHRATIIIIAIGTSGGLVRGGMPTTNQAAGQPSVTASTQKSSAENQGRSDAIRDIQKYRESLNHKTPEELIKSFILDTPDRYGGYEYYFKYMANNEIRGALKARGPSAKDAISKHLDDSTRIFEAINGPGDTIGSVCKALLQDQQPATRPAP